MGNFNRDKRSRSGDNRGFGNPRFNRERPEMHQATCSSCGRTCEVPFRPTGSKPVYCNDCFKNIKTSGGRGYENRPMNDTSNYNAQFEALNTKLDKIISLLTKTLPLESAFDEKVIDEIIEEVQDDNKKVVKRKPKKAATKKE